MSSSGRDRTAVRNAESTGQNGGASAMSMALPVSTTASARRACRTSSPTSLVLPTPASPPTRTAPAWPTQAARKASVSVDSSRERPRNPSIGVSGYRGSLPPTSRCRCGSGHPTGGPPVRRRGDVAERGVDGGEHRIGSARSSQVLGAHVDPHRSAAPQHPGDPERGRARAEHPGGHDGARWQVVDARTRRPARGSPARPARRRCRRTPASAAARTRRSTARPR